MSALKVNARIAIPDDELKERFIRSSGPGGQNVNKVASAVELRFDVRASSSLTDLARAALLFSGRLTKDGVLVIRAERFRDQEKNRADARARLAAIIAAAATPPKPRRKTKVPKASKTKRRDDKKRRAEVKQGRGKPSAD
ncbi:MAG: aminoacyl-tRNA hydrolase [Alphaproteobacteria bacterium]|nr:aminoacyl-tRNA hydrolase [Alphaproteobacteria bacterium]